MHFDHVWSEFVTLPSSFSFCLLGIWIIKEQSLKGAFSFSISSISYFSERSTPVFLLCKLSQVGKAWGVFQYGQVFQSEVTVCQELRLNLWLLLYIVNKTLFHMLFMSLVSFDFKQPNLQINCERWKDEKAMTTQAIIMNQTPFKFIIKKKKLLQESDIKTISPSIPLSSHFLFGTFSHLSYRNSNWKKETETVIFFHTSCTSYSVWHIKHRWA